MKTVKKAYLVTFTTTTRVVVDVPEGFDVNNCNLVKDKDANAFDSIIKSARSNILEEPQNYMFGDNAEVNEDTEIPYEAGD